MESSQSVKILIALCLTLIATSLEALDPEIASRILYVLQKGSSQQAIEIYKENVKDDHDNDIVQNIAINILKEGFQTQKPEIQLMAIFGAGISLNEKMITLLETGLNSPVPEIQLASLSFMSRFQNNQADESLNKAMASDYLAIRLETAFLLAEKKHPKVLPQIEALLHKTPKQIHSLFPQLFAMIGTSEAIKTLKKMLASPIDNVKIEAIRSVADFGRDDLISKVRTLVLQHNPIQQEVACYALGALKDENSALHLERLSKSSISSVRLAALKALYQLGRKEVIQEIEKEAMSLNLFAIQLLGELADNEELLLMLIKNPKLQVRINAAIALLNQQNPRCLPILFEILIQDSKDLALSIQTSFGRTLSCYKVITSATEHFKEKTTSQEISLAIRELVLQKAAELPEKDFLNLAYTLFSANQNTLVPTLVHLLEQLQSKDAIDLLKIHQQKAGAPLVRNYCNLALYRLKEEGPYFENLKNWLLQQQNQELIRFRPMTEKNGWQSTHFQLTPEETSRLLVEAYEAVTKMQEKESIDILLNAIRNGNPNNKFALAGLLIRATQ